MTRGGQYDGLHIKMFDSSMLHYMYYDIQGF